MTTDQLDIATGPRVAPFAAAVVLPIAGVVVVLHCAASVFGGYWFDEVYMLAIGRHHLDWGSADQPPLAPALAALMDAVAPGSFVALRLPTMLATSGAVVVAGLIARELGCDRRAQGFTAAAQATGAWATLTGHWLTPYTLEPVQWLLIIWLLVRWVRMRDDRLKRCGFHPLQLRYANLLRRDIPWRPAGFTAYRRRSSAWSSVAPHGRSALR